MPNYLLKRQKQTPHTHTQTLSDRHLQMWTRFISIYSFKTTIYIEYCGRKVENQKM